MNLNERKIEFIQRVIEIENEDLMTELEAVLLNKYISLDDDNIEPMTVQEFQERIEQSRDDIENGRFITQEDLEKEIKNWK